MSPVDTLGQDVVEETRAFNAELERLRAAETPVYTLPPAVVRRARRKGAGPFPPPVYLPQARDVTIPGRGGEIRLRVLAPEGDAAGVYLHFHGGGWTLGAVDLQDPLLAALAERTGLVVASVEYRLAPEHPHPAGADDCEDAALWLLDGGARELGAAGRLAVGGESAGAHLAVMTLLRLRDAHGVSPRTTFAAVNLVAGCFDLSGTPSRRLWGPWDLILSAPTMEWFIDGLLPGVGLEARRASALSPLFAPLHDLPRALFTVGTLDPLLDDSLFMAARWRAAGNEAELRVWQDAVHGFSAFTLEIARRSHDDQFSFLGR